MVELLTVIQEDQFKSEEVQAWLITRFLGWAMACTSGEFTEQLN